MNTSRDRNKSPRGQILVIFAGSIFMLMLLTALVVDVSWYWVNSLRVQRAADAAALAGAVLLPSDRPNAYDRARKEATKNGYTAVVGNGITVTPLTVNATPRRLSVTIAAPIGTFFMRVVGITSIPVNRTGRAEFTLPVPMGSPENYYGVFGMTRGLTTTSTTNANVSSNTDSGTDEPGTAPGVAGWTANTGTLVNAVNGNDGNDSPRAQTSTTNSTQRWGNFGLTSQLSGSQTVTAVRGFRVFLNDAFISATCANSRIQVQLSWDGGTTWTMPPTDNETTNLRTNDDDDYQFGNANNLTDWVFAAPGHAWVPADLANGRFEVRTTAIKGCATVGTQLRLDQLQVIAYYTITTPTQVTTTLSVTDENLKGPGAACLNAVAACYLATGSNLNPRGFWGTQLTEGAANINGDAYQPYYDTVGGTASPACSAPAAANRACYDPISYYNYGIEMPPGSTGGSVYIYDPVFCDVENDKGTGDRWFGGIDPVSTFYELYNTRNTLYEELDDILLANSGGLFRNIEASDTTMGGTTSSSADECRYETDGTYGDGRDYHNKWYLLYSGLTGGSTGTIYRVHTTSTDPANAAAQRGTDGENSFAIYASAAGGTPKVYGLGAMQAYTPLKAANSTVTSDFYLAQLEAVHKGKTVEIRLWDPGDTNPLTASIQIMIPTSSGWTATPVTYSAVLGTTNSGRADGTGGKPNCTTNQRTTASTAGIVTFNNADSSNTGRFNGCWLTILAQIPTGYSAEQQGWWQIRYTMSGNGTSNDVTTWQVAIRGNPVHLVTP